MDQCICDFCGGPTDGAAFQLKIIHGEIEPQDRKVLFCSHMCLCAYTIVLAEDGYSTDGCHDADLPRFRPVRTFAKALNN